MKTVVMKFGGSSLGTPALREEAVRRVLEIRARGTAPVVVCSALGRAPEPYATDSLIALFGSARSGPNRDLLLACGELIAAAVFAELLTEAGASAQAMTGAQAGIVTDGAFGDARIVRVDTVNLIAALEDGVIPVVAGFQGVTDGGATTTLGRGGSDLTAIALGAALGSAPVEIFTDTSGVMSSDPRNVDGAHTIDRASSSEMVELAAEGAKVMHHKAAELAHASRTPYAIKGLQSNYGTTIDDALGTDPQRPVTGIASRGEVTFLRITIPRDGAAGRARDHAVLFGRLADLGVSIDMINVNAAGIFFVIDAARLDAVRPELARLGLPSEVRPACAAISIVGVGMRGTPGVMYRVVRALDGAGVEIIHSTDSNITISILVPLADEVRAQRVLHEEFHLARPEPAASANREAIA
jgi:aspartate kinase